MYQKNLLRKKRNRTFAALFAFLLTLVVTTTLAMVNGIDNHKKSVLAQAQEARHILDDMLNDARLATTEASSLLGKICDFNVEKDLNMIPGRYMHIYSINFLRDQHITCSSLLANKHADVHDILPPEKLLWMSHAVSSPDIEVISLITPFAQGKIYVASDLRFLRSIMGDDLVIQVSGKTITAAGLVTDALKAPRFRDFESLPTQSPLYTMGWKAQSFNTLIRNTLCAWQDVTFILLMSAVMAVVTWLLATRRHSLYAQLANAIRQRQIHPHYQPLICAQTNRVSGAEVLARWQHDELGFVAPDVFIPVAESTGLIIELTESLLEQVVDDLEQNIALFPPGFKLNLNISYSHVIDGSFNLFVDYWAPIFAALGVTLVFEITERENIDMSDDIVEKVVHLKRSGIKIALDDFGTGFSNLAFIANLNPDSIKIDRMFIRQISQDVATPLIECVIDMAKRMNILTTAEGVEHDYQVEYLRANQIDCLQGYFFSKPLRFGDFAHFLQGYRSA